MYQRTRIPKSQFINPIGRPYQNKENRQRQECTEDLELPRYGCLGLRTLSCFHVADGVFNDEREEEGDGDDLEGETGNGDIYGDLRTAVGAGGEGAADGLDAEGDDIARDEDPVVEFWGEAGVLGTKVDDAIFSVSIRKSS